MRIRSYYRPDSFGSPYVPCFAVSIHGEAGLRLLRRLVCIDAARLSVGAASFAPMLDAMGHIDDVGVLVRTAQDHFVFFAYSPEAMAWVHQVNKAFDASIKVEEYETVLAWPEEGGQVVPESFTSAALGDIFAVRLKRALILAARKLPESLFVSAHGLDGNGALAVLLKSGERYAGDWAGSPTVFDCGFSDALDFRDASRVFIGRAISESLAKVAVKNVMVALKARAGALAGGGDAEPEILREDGTVFAASGFVLGNDGFLVRFFAPKKDGPWQIHWQGETLPAKLI